MRKMNLTRNLAAFIGSCALVASILPAALAQNLPKPLIPITQDFKLPNGLHVVLSEDHSAPEASIVLVYDVGARDEQKGRSGFAHLFEHMMFEGSQNVAKTEHFKLVQGAGGSCNASTHDDCTTYYDRVPSNQINLILWLEADRMRSLKVTEENFKNQLETVKEEKRLRIDNQAYQPSMQKADGLIYDNWQSGHPIIGSFEDLEASSINDVRNFFKTYYAPNNAVIAVVGDIDANQVHQAIEKYFGDIPAMPQPTRPSLAEPAQTQPRYAKYDDEHAKVPAFLMAWKVPGYRQPDYFALDLMQKIMSDGESSRMYQRMIKGDQIALSASIGMDTRRGPSTFDAFVMIKPNTTAEKAREVVWDEINKIKTKPVSKEELEKAKHQILREFFSSGGGHSLQRTMGRAEMLARYTSFYGDPKLLDEDVATMMSITPKDIQRVANKYFTKDALTVIDIVPMQDKAQAETGHSQNAASKATHPDHPEQPEQSVGHPGLAPS